MGLSPLGPKKVRRMERVTGLRIEWGSVFCHGGAGHLWRFWTPVSDTEVELGYFNSRDETWKMTGLKKERN